MQKPASARPRCCRAGKISASPTPANGWMNSAPMTNATRDCHPTGAPFSTVLRDGGHTSVGGSGARSIGRHGRRNASTRQTNTASEDTISAMLSVRCGVHRTCTANVPARSGVTNHPFANESIGCGPSTRVPSMSTCHPSFVLWSRTSQNGAPSLCTLAFTLVACCESIVTVGAVGVVARGGRPRRRSPSEGPSGRCRCRCRDRPQS